MSTEQSYLNTGGIHDGNDEWNRLNAAIRSVTNQMATMTLVRVVAARAGVVDIQPIVAQLDGAGNAVPHGTIFNVPVWRMQAGGAAVILEPVAQDIGLALFAHNDISTAKATQAESPPGSKRRFDWADAVYMGGLFGTPAQYVRVSGSGIELVAPTVSASASLTAGSGATGTVTTTDGKVVTFVSGIAVDIS